MSKKAKGQPAPDTHKEEKGRAKQEKVKVKVKEAKADVKDVTVDVKAARVKGEPANDAGEKGKRGKGKRAAGEGDHPPGEAASAAPVTQDAGDEKKPGKPKKPKEPKEPKEPKLARKDKKSKKAAKEAKAAKAASALGSKIEARRSTIHGNGVFAIAPISKGEQVIRYLGRLTSHDDVDERYGGQDEDGHTFLFTLNDDWVIDANFRGNVARWINHSCDPNCESSVEEDAKGRSDHDRIYIEALRDILPGEELTYNYGIVLDEPHTAAAKKLWGCRCGASNCTGTMLQPKRGRAKA